PRKVSVDPTGAPARLAAQDRDSVHHALTILAEHDAHMIGVRRARRGTRAPHRHVLRAAVRLLPRTLRLRVGVPAHRCVQRREPRVVARHLQRTNFEAFDLRLVAHGSPFSWTWRRGDSNPRPGCAKPGPTPMTPPDLTLLSA